MTEQSTNEQMKMLVKAAIENNGIIKADSEMTVVFKDGDELNVKFDMIISINEVN